MKPRSNSASGQPSSARTWLNEALEDEAALELRLGAALERLVEPGPGLLRAIEIDEGGPLDAQDGYEEVHGVGRAGAGLGLLGEDKTALGIAGMRLPFVEPAVLASVLALGALIAFAARLPLGAGAAAVSVAAFFHGQAHGSEIPANTSGFLAVAGFVIATALLHGAGILGGLALRRTAQQRALRTAGAAIFSAAVLMVLGVL